MAYQPLRNVPAFHADGSDEDNHWKKFRADGSDSGPSRQPSSYAYLQSRPSANSHAKKPSISSDQIKEKIGDFLGTESEENLPLYKDKPRFPSRKRGALAYLPSRRNWKKWGLFGIVLFIVYWFSSFVLSWFGVSEIAWVVRRDMVRRTFVLSWNDYATHAWGKDVYSPISQHSKFLLESSKSGAGWIIVDALDTAMIMNCTKEVGQARKWIKTSLDFGKLDGQLSTFETTIRVLGGLLSAHYLSTTFPTLAAQRDDDWGQKGEDLYIEKAVDLADRLLNAFDTPTGIPLSHVNLNNSRGIVSTSDQTSIAEAGTLQLELKYITKLTGEPLYWTIAEKVMQAIDDPRSPDGLVPIFINLQTGKFEGKVIRLGSRADSYYEYLIKQYLQTGETIYKDMWDEALNGIKRHLITWSRYADFTVLAERPDGLKGEWSGKMDHLTCFLPGTIALSVTGGLSVTEAKKKMGSAWGRQQEEDLVLAEELMKTCMGMYVSTPTGLAPEITYLSMDEFPREWKFDDSTWKQPRSKADLEDVRSKDYTSKTAAWRKDYEVRAPDVHNLQRPEAVESLYYLWRITGNSFYRDWGWKIFRSFEEYTKVINSKGKVSGFTSLESVTQIPPKHLDSLIAGTNIAHQMATTHGKGFARDNMEGFWLSETLKYLYLLFSENISDEWNDMSKVVVNTEAHFFPRFDTTGHNVFKTGWSRKDKPASS